MKAKYVAVSALSVSRCCLLVSSKYVPEMNKKIKPLLLQYLAERNQKCHTCCFCCQKQQKVSHTFGVSCCQLVIIEMLWLWVACLTDGRRSVWVVLHNGSLGRSVGRTLLCLHQVRVLCCFVHKCCMVASCRGTRLDGRMSYQLRPGCLTTDRITNCQKVSVTPVSDTSH